MIGTPEVPVEAAFNMGSFDCVADRFATGNFAQDDKQIEMTGQNHFGLITSSNAEITASPAEK